jgi:hypothetical protein
MKSILMLHFCLLSGLCKRISSKRSPQQNSVCMPYFLQSNDFTILISLHDRYKTQIYSISNILNGRLKPVQFRGLCTSFVTHSILWRSVVNPTFIKPGFRGWLFNLQLHSISGDRLLGLHIEDEPCYSCQRANFTWRESITT